MTTDINMSLDDIIKKNKLVKGFSPRRKKPNVNARKNLGTRSIGSGAGGAGFKGPRSRNNNYPTRSAARFSPYKRGDIDSPWSHDLYEGSFIGKQRGGAEGTKIIISNLEFGVTDSDLEELFMEVGPLLSSEIHYDKSGRSMGSGSVVFQKRTDAIRALNQYNGIPLDGRPMEIEIASSAPSRLIESRRVGNFKNRNAGGGGGAFRKRRFSGGSRGGNIGGNRNRRGAANISAEQLDAELDEYRAKAI